MLAIHTLTHTQYKDKKEKMEQRMQKEHFSHCRCVTNMMEDINQIKPGDINFHTAIEMNNRNP